MTDKTIREKGIRISHAAWILLAVYLLSIIPLLLIGRYNFPSADDFSMGHTVHQALIHDGMLAALREDVSYSWGVYVNWTGYFTSNLLMCFPPNVFGEESYRWGIWIVLAALSCSTIYFVYVVLKKAAGVSGTVALAVSSLVLFMSVQSMPAGLPRTEAFYWYCSAANYTLTYSLGLWYLGLLFSYVCSDSGKGGRVRYVLLVLLSFWIGGTNYMTSLTCAFLSVLVMCSRLPFGRKLTAKLRGRDQTDPTLKPFWPVAVPCLLMLAGFACSCLAPGNNVRGSALEGFGAVKSILISLYYTLRYCVNLWTRWEILVLLLFMLPILWIGAKNSKLTFGCPLVVSVLLYGLAAMSFCPALFALGNIVAGRLQALIWLQYLLCLVMGAFYWIGWLQRNTVLRLAAGCDADRKEMLSGAALKYMAVLGLFFIFGSAMCVKTEPNYYAMTAAAADLLNGHAATYAAENAERLQILKDPEITDAQLMDYTFRPELLYFSDIDKDPGNWINGSIARYYGKNSVNLVPREKQTDGE